MEMIFVIAVVVLIIGVFVLGYNRLVSLKNRVENAWHQVDVQLRRRYDLIPNLVETVKGYAAHEKELFENVTRARAAAISAKSVKEQSEAENMLTETLKSLFAVAENYPDLKASQNFMMLQEELSGTESKIAYARQFYNDSVMAYNEAIQKFPTNIIASLFGFKERDYFIVEGEAREPVKVSFSKD